MSKLEKPTTISSNLPEKNYQAGFTIIELMIASTICTFLIFFIGATAIYISQYLNKAVWSSEVQSDARLFIDQITLPIQLSGEKIVLGNGGNPWPSPGAHGLQPTLILKTLCIGSTRFTWTEGLTDNIVGPPYDHTNHTIRHVLWKDVLTDDPTGLCPPANLTAPIGGNPDFDGTTFYPSPYEPSTFSRDVNSYSDLIKRAHGIKSLSISQSPTNNRLYIVNLELFFGNEKFIIRSSSMADNNIDSCQLITLGGEFCGISKFDTSIYRRLL